jgi:hypothetical protein
MVRLIPGLGRTHSDILHMGLHHIVWHVPGALYVHRALHAVQHLLDRGTYGFFLLSTPLLSGAASDTGHFKLVLRMGIGL